MASYKNIRLPYKYFNDLFKNGNISVDEFSTLPQPFHSKNSSYINGKQFLTKTEFLDLINNEPNYYDIEYLSYEYNLKRNKSGMILFNDIFPYTKGCIINMVAWWIYDMIKNDFKTNSAGKIFQFVVDDNIVFEHAQLKILFNEIKEYSTLLIYFDSSKFDNYTGIIYDLYINYKNSELYKKITVFSKNIEYDVYKSHAIVKYFIDCEYNNIKSDVDEYLEHSINENLDIYLYTQQKLEEVGIYYAIHEIFTKYVCKIAATNANNAYEYLLSFKKELLKVLFYMASQP